MILILIPIIKSASGKVAAQCAHAACGSVEVATKRNPDILKKWRVEGQAKVSLEKLKKKIKKKKKKSGKCIIVMNFIAILSGLKYLNLG